MPDLVLFDNNNSFDYAAVKNRLADLAQFGVHLHPIPQNNKCVCGGKAEWPWSHGWGYDNLCKPCSQREGGSEAFYDRIYTNQTVFVSDPIITKSGSYNDDGVFRQTHHSFLYGLVVVDARLCLIRTSIQHIEGRGWQPPGFRTSDLCDQTTGEVIVNFVFHIDYDKLSALGQTQLPL